MLSILLPEELEERLERLAVRTGRSTTFHVQEALVQYLDDLEDFYLAEDVLTMLGRADEKAFPSKK
jgi:RHH-type rel operon transcriptional repressor/antitoxin RelB